MSSSSHISPRYCIWLSCTLRFLLMIALSQTPLPFDDPNSWESCSSACWSDSPLLKSVWSILGRAQWESEVCIIFHLGYILAPWLLTITVDLYALAEIAFVKFLPWNSSSLSSLPTLYSFRKNSGHIATPWQLDPTSIRKECVYKFWKAPRHGRFVSSLPHLSI